MCGEDLPAVVGQCLAHSHHSGQDKPAPLAPAVPGTAPPGRVSLAPLPRAEFSVLWPGGEGEMLPSADPTCTERELGWDNSRDRVRHLPALPSLPIPNLPGFRAGQTLPRPPRLVLGMVAGSSSFVSGFFTHRPPAPGELWGDRRLHTSV